MHSGILGAFQQPQHLHRAIAGFGFCGGGTGQQRPCRHLGINPVVLAVLTAQLTVGTTDLPHAAASRQEMAAETRAVGAAALQGNKQIRWLQGAMANSPLEKGLVALTGGRDLQVAQHGAMAIKSHRNVLVFVGVNADEHRGTGQRCQD